MFAALGKSLRAARSLGVAMASLLLCAGIISCRSQASSQAAAKPSTAPAWFEEVAVASGLNFKYASGYETRPLFPEIMGGGVCLIDYDDDSRLDIYFVQGGSLTAEPASRPGNVLYRNLGGGKFEDVTEAAGVGDRGYGMGCTVGDYDGDGRPDLYVLNVGANVLYRNRGDGTFEDVTPTAGVGDPSWSVSATFLDYDADGHQDLFIANYLNWSPARELTCVAIGGRPDYCSPLNYNAPAPNHLYRNLGDGTFADVSQAAGLRAADGTSLGVVAADVNQDGRVDVYVANDGMPNQLWINQGDGRFRDEALLGGCAVNVNGRPEAGMGVQAVDVDYDGDIDLFVTHLRNETNTLYLNHDPTRVHFDDSSSGSGLGAASLPYTGFGLAFADFNHDGRLDLFVANGRVRQAGRPVRGDDPYAEPNLLFEGLGGAKLREKSPPGGTAASLVAASHGLAAGDLDNDGDIDLVIVNRDHPAHLLRNIAADGRWIILRVRERDGSDALGALVTLRVAGGGQQTRLIGGNYGYASSSDPRAHFGLARTEQIEQITVRWPDGAVEQVGPRELDKVHTIQRQPASRE